MANDTIEQRQTRLRIAYGELMKRGLALTKRDIATALGTAPSYISSAFKGNPSVLTDNFLNRLNQAFGNIFDPAWLVNGEGEFAVEGVPSQQADPGYIVPLVPVDALAGSLPIAEQTAALDQCQRITVPIKGIDLAINISGDSMAPDYPSGCIALMQRVDGSAFIEWGKVYVLDTVNGPVIKQVYPSEVSPDHVHCVSFNPSYPPFDVAKADIRQMFIVRMTMTPR